MVKVSIEVRNGAARFDVAVQAENIQRALSFVGKRYPDGNVRVKFPIDAVFVGKDGHVTKIAHNLKPWRVVWWARGARDCLELRAGAAAESGTQVGDELALIASHAA